MLSMMIVDIDTINRDSIDLDQFKYAKPHTINVYINNQRYLFTCKTLKHDKVMKHIVNNVYPSKIFMGYSLDYIINICSFLDDKEREYYKLLYL